MNAKQRKKIETFKKAITFLDVLPPVLANAPPGFAKQVQILKNAVATISQVAPDRGSGKPAKTAAQRATLREALRIGQLQPLRKVARVLGKQVAGMPKLVNVKKSAGTQSLLDSAKAVLRDLEPYQEQFIDKGVAVDFLDQLDAGIRALEMVGQANVTANMARTRARGTLRQVFEEGGDALMLIDSVVRHSCNADPARGAATLMAWNTIISPRGKAHRTASNVASETAADVTGGGDETSTTVDGVPEGSST
ncbi:MAG TPA: hypothetical protein VNU46_10000 [Gemmatimonadaceae bacterium]|jgi:hypothetical protein|nr:hypothetical protein [Gemmatimonadaceae bacterium]